MLLKYHIIGCARIPNTIKGDSANFTTLLGPSVSVKVEVSVNIFWLWFWSGFQRVSENQNQSNYSSQSQRTEIIQWTNQKLKWMHVADVKRGKTIVSESDWMNNWREFCKAIVWHRWWKTDYFSTLRWKLIRRYLIYQLFVSLSVIKLAVICLQCSVTSFYDEYGNVSRVVGLYESANGIIMKLDSLLTPPMPAVSRPAVCN